MPVLTDEQRALIGQESEPRALPQPIDRIMALRWCEMVEDANPVYFDEAYARTTWLQGTIGAWGGGGQGGGGAGAAGAGRLHDNHRGERG